MNDLKIEVRTLVDHAIIFSQKNIISSTDKAKTIIYFVTS